jgi:hypothetical protein
MHKQIIKEQKKLYSFLLVRAIVVGAVWNIVVSIL